MRPEYEAVKARRWTFSSLVSKIALQTTSIPCQDNRVIFPLSLTSGQGCPMIEDDETYYSIFNQPKPFLIETEYAYYPSSGGFVVIENDPMNSLDIVIPIAPDIRQKAKLEAEKRIGNIRMGPKRFIMHLGGTNTVRHMNDLKDPNVGTSIPLYPPRSLDLTNPDRIFLLHYSMRN